MYTNGKTVLMDFPVPITLPARPSSYKNGLAPLVCFELLDTKITNDGGRMEHLNFSKLATNELEAFIAQAIEERAKRASGKVDQPAHASFASMDPAWNGSLMSTAKLILTLHHSGAGPVSFVFGKSAFALLYGYMAQVAALGGLTDEAITPSGTTPTRLN